MNGITDETTSAEARLAAGIRHLRDGIDAVVTRGIERRSPLLKCASVVLILGSVLVALGEKAPDEQMDRLLTVASPLELMELLLVVSKRWGQ